MKKICILFFILSFTLYFSGCSFNNSQTVNEPALTPEAIDKSLVENKYYEKNTKIDNSYLYIDHDERFCIQLPNDVRLQEKSESNEHENILTAQILSAGSISVRLDNQSYISLDINELQSKYNSENIDDNELGVTYEVKDFTIITDEYNNEIGRTYTLQTSDGAVIFRGEYKNSDNTIVVLGMPFDDNEDYDIIKRYFHSFMMCSGNI